MVPYMNHAGASIYTRYSQLELLASCFPLIIMRIFSRLWLEMSVLLFHAGAAA